METKTPSMEADERYNERQEDIKAAVASGYVWVTAAEGSNSILKGFKYLAPPPEGGRLFGQRPVTPEEFETLPLIYCWDEELPVADPSRKQDVSACNTGEDAV